MNQFCNCQNEIPYGVVRLLRKYGPNLRKHIEAAVADCMRRGINLDHMDQVQECISKGIEAFMEEARDRSATAPPDEQTVTGALDDYRAGRWTNLRDMIDALHRSGS